LNTSFEKAIDTPILCRSNLLKKFPETPVPHHNAVRRLIEKFREIGSVSDAERSGRPSELNGEKLMDISDSMLRRPSKPLRKLVQEEGINEGHSFGTIDEIMNIIHYERKGKMLDTLEKFYFYRQTKNGNQINDRLTV